MSDDFLCSELSRHDKVVSSVRKMLSGCRSLLKHVVFHRGQLFMILNREEFNDGFHVKVDSFDYVLHATSSHMKCFSCGEEGHLIETCSNLTGPVQSR